MYKTNTEPLLDLAQVGLSLSSPVQLLRGITFTVKEGDRLGIVGASGAGKTSLLRLINRLSEATQGSLRFQGQDIRQINVLKLRQQVVLVPQESKLLGMTVEDALAYPLRLQGLAVDTIRQRMQTWLEKLTIPLEWLDRTEVQLSVGQRQLVAIARALVMQPHLLLLDEPTSALDAGRATQLLTVLTELVQSQPMALIMINHQLELVRRFCTRVLVLQQGELILDAAVETVNWEDLHTCLLQTQAEQSREWEA
ncbi:cobalt ABC transporter [Neosynechococcus sphagnicola sy1]|uniref:Cobalt ABC transporter n=1 Tax=Neosynechococcus sphagnicola sy1 TaxID=1497020 RepID=A0A098TN88_9CYAN|nr:ATP-binding cassette domain-containing protein [Neosynechococcus sphagnicola]KGF73721.1 cobalt ABC transporter [Neosynechococcus sphagnicola sy1]